jgi:uncharacterized membrane protein (UPF0127 family)
LNRHAGIVIASLLFLLTGCGSTAPQSHLRTVPMQIGSKQFTLEVADTWATQEHGLMERDSLPESHGMIFVFAEEADHEFYMKHTRIPLDILFLDHTGKIISAKTMSPYDLTLVPSDGPAKYAIELNAGQIQATGVTVGQTLDVPADAREPKP